ncbi:FAD dependent oxidoreductase [Ilyonectria robusta]|uniref:FAD dependent oxidoreductase n=1 Tax=Ilyonectria robusta TaxID=1079257 RepID=UPI001E8CCD77|nr:FAD dependent oxidoreductase [Ilyonectria robusta]KAH8673197.1 FAD dependent oxidoreductase [Ilyonectria robusta]
MSPSTFPPPNGMKSFWRANPGTLDNHRSTAQLPEECDIVVVGAGYSAAALVTHIIAQAKGNLPSILVLEARQLCSGATGRNGGHLKPDSYYSISRLATEYGIDAAAEVANFESANVDAVTEFIRENKVDCDFILTRATDVQFSVEHQEKVRAGYERLLAAGVKATNGAYCAEDRYAEKLSGVKGAKGCFSYTAGHLWPYKLIHHMFSKAIEQGVNLQTNTPVQSVSSGPDATGRWILKTSRGVVKAKQVVMATNAYTSALLPEYTNKIIPYRAVCSHIVTPGKAPLLTNSYALRFAEWDFDYLIPRPDGSIIVGGARRAYIGHQEDWYGNVDDTKLIERARHYFDGYMQRHFSGWENSGAYVDDIWTGIMGYSSDRLPRVGPIPSRPGMFIMGGFTGHGMPQVFLCAQGVTDMVLEGKQYSETGLPRLFEESSKRLQDPRNRVMEFYESLPLSAKL